MRLPTYMLQEKYEIPDSDNILPQGAFVKPIDDYYLPKHIKETNNYYWRNKEEVVYCYCHFGIIQIPRRLIRTV